MTFPQFDSMWRGLGKHGLGEAWPREAWPREAWPREACAGSLESRAGQTGEKLVVRGH